MRIGTNDQNMLEDSTVRQLATQMADGQSSNRWV